MKVLGIGESVIDKAYIVPSELMDGPIPATIEPTQHIGGPVVTALILLAKLGIDSTLLTSLGKDTEGSLIKKTLTEQHVKLLAKPQKKTKINSYLINQANGSRRKIRGNIVHTPINTLDSSFIRQFDLIIIDRHEHEAFYEILEKKKPTAKILIDPSTEVSPFTLDMIQYADYPIVPIEALHQLNTLPDLLSRLGKLYQLSGKSVIVTAGEEGSIIYNGSTLDTIPAIPVNAIDVQGAGDIYRGGVAYGILQGWELKRSALFGSIVAGLQCTKIGNADAVPSVAEIEQICQFVQAKQTDIAMIRNHFLQGYK